MTFFLNLKIVYCIKKNVLTENQTNYSICAKCQLFYLLNFIAQLICCI